MSNYPWDELMASGDACEYTAKMLPAELNPSGRRVFWAKSKDNNPTLLVEYECDPWRPIRLPLFKNIKVCDYRSNCCLAIELLDLGMRDVFLKLSLDIVSTLQDVPTSAVRKAAVLRLERWSSFLSPSRSKLSPESQKGLIAELLFLKRDALDRYDAGTALMGWVGPESAPRDFSYGQVFIEVKSKRGSSNPSIEISSEDQLNINPSERLFLYVSELNATTPEDKNGQSITDVVIATRDALGSSLLASELDNKLAEVGFFEEDDYSDSHWSEGETYYYEVVEDFPKIDSRSCRTGVCKVSYQIDLDYCDDFLVDRTKLLDSME